MADGRLQGFAAGGEVVLAPTEYEWGIRQGGAKEEPCFGLGRACFWFFEQMGHAFLKFGEITNFPPLLNFGPTAGRG